MPQKIDLIGQIFGRLTVIGQWVEDGTSRCLCKCSCGASRIVRSNHLRMGRTQSCRCQIADKLIRHGESKSNTPEYVCWKSMISRCYIKSATAYQHYGGRGITVCNRWRHSYVNFLSDMGRRPSPKHSLDRKDNNKGYYPENCKWATQREQCLNRRPKRG